MRDYRLSHPDERLVAVIPDETGIIPWLVARNVCEEAGLWLGVPLPQEWSTELAEHAEAIYQHNPRFRRLLRRRANAGRDCLYAFTRHWLCAILDSRRPHLLCQLPRSYARGQDLPGPTPKPPRGHPEALW